MQSKELVELVEAAVDDLKGVNVKILEVSKLTSITDYMVVVSGTSARHVRSMADRILERAKAAGAEPIGVEGQEHGEWVLVDLGDVLAHLMLAKTREFYKLENLWNMDDDNSQSSLAAGDADVAR